MAVYLPEPFCWRRNSCGSLAIRKAARTAGRRLHPYPRYWLSRQPFLLPARARRAPPAESCASRPSRWRGAAATDLREPRCGGRPPAPITLYVFAGAAGAQLWGRGLRPPDPNHRIAYRAALLCQVTLDQPLSRARARRAPITLSVFAFHQRVTRRCRRSAPAAAAATGSVPQSPPLEPTCSMA